MNNFWRSRLLISLCVLLCTIGYAQDTTAVLSRKSVRKSPLKSFIAPAALMTVGLFINETNGSFSKYNIQNGVQEHFAINTKADDYLQYYPFAIFLAFKALKKDGTNSTKKQLLLLGKSQVLMAGFVHLLKTQTNTPRPPGANGRRSFPSGHTSMSFAAASFFYKEYHATNKALAWSGYALATTTGLMRVMNDEHWMSDIVFGAGLGILCTELVYLHHNRKRKKKNKYTSLLVLPEVGTQRMGFTLNYKF